MNYKTTGSFISNLRKQQELTQEEFATQFHVTHQAVSKWENGLSLPDTETLIGIANYYNIKVDDILNAKTECTPDIKFEFGFGIIPYVDVKNEDNLLSRITALRTNFKSESGLEIPQIHVLDNFTLKELEYRISVNDTILMDNHLDLVNEDDRIIEMLSFLSFIIKNHVISYECNQK